MTPQDMKRVLSKMDKLPFGSAGAFLLDPKWLSLSCFILQNSLLIIGMKACVINSSHSMNSYIASTAVILSEVLKFILSTIACYLIDCKGNYKVFREVIYNIVMEEGADVMKLCVPALLYTIQNNLQYVIEEAPLFVVLYQAKIVTTALFYSTMLNRRMNSKEWMCIVALTLGVVMVESSQVEVVPNHVGKFTGILAVIFACLTSGVAGVYFEKILKSSRSSIWVINMQMSLLSAFFCTSVALTQDSLEIAHHGLFTGYNPLVLLSIVLQAFTGLAVALVVKYADNLYKGFGHSLSLVICSCVSSILFEDTSVNEAFLLGSFLVIASSTAFASVAQIEPASAHGRSNQSGGARDKDKEKDSSHPSIRNSITAAVGTNNSSSAVPHRTLTSTVGSAYHAIGAAGTGLGGEFAYDSSVHTSNNNTAGGAETDVESALDAADLLTDAEWASPVLGAGDSNIRDGGLNSGGISGGLSGSHTNSFGQLAGAGGGYNEGTAFDGTNSRKSSAPVLTTLDNTTSAATNSNSTGAPLRAGWLGGVWGQESSAGGIGRTRSGSRVN